MLLNLKKYAKLTLSTVLLLSISFSYTFALEPSDTPQTIIQKGSEDDLKISEIEKIFQEYLDENNITIELGTEEYLDYVYTQMLDMDNRDEKLLQHPKYDLICDYFAEYIVANQNYELEKYSSSNARRLKSSTQNKMTLDYLKNKDKSISEIKEESIKEDKAISQEESLINTVNKQNTSLRRLRGYSPSKAVNYAHKWARGFSPDYANFDKKGGDCTNFVSQCLVAGGATQTRAGNVREPILNAPNNWYGGKFSNSTPFIRVASFHSYWASRVPDANYESSKTVSKNGNVGDVVQFRRPNTGVRWHTMIITKKQNGVVYLTGHSQPRYDYSINNYDDKTNNWTLFDF